MGGVERFEDLICWQKARQLTRVIYVITRRGTFGRDFGLGSQMQRAAVSVMATFAEGFERNRPAEFHQYLSIAKGSCGELRSHLYVALDAGYLTQAAFAEHLAQAEEVTRIICGLRLSVEHRRAPNPTLSTKH